MNWKYYFETIEEYYAIELPRTIKNNIKYNYYELNISVNNEYLENVINSINNKK